jgi:addiction module HigA family antidote
MTTRTYPPQPAAVLRDEIIRHLQVSQAALARRMGVSKVTVHNLVSGRARITAGLALRLAHATDTRPEHWLKVQSEYDLCKARKYLGPALRKLPTIADERRRDVCHSDIRPATSGSATPA